MASLARGQGERAGNCLGDPVVLAAFNEGAGSEVLVVTETSDGRSTVMICVDGQYAEPFRTGKMRAMVDGTRIMRQEMGPAV